MNDINPNDLQPGVKVAFYERPNDKMPAIVTEVVDTDYDGRKVHVLAKGLPDWYPFYHFHLWTSTMSYGVLVTNPLDELQKNLGI